MVIRGKMILISGGCGFIGSNLVRKLNLRNIFDIIIVNGYSLAPYAPKLKDKKFSHYWHKDNLFKNLKFFKNQINQIG